MHDYYKERIAALRKKYADTGEAEYRHRHAELLRAWEHYQLLQIDKTRGNASAGQVQGRNYNPLSPHL